MTDAVGSKPTLLVWMEDRSSADLVFDQLRQRYSFDYEIVRLVNPGHLGAVDVTKVALVLADVTSPATAALLTTVKEASPSTRRAGTAPWGMPVSVETLQKLLRSGLVEWFVTLPKILPDEQFHRGVSEFLEEWSRENSKIFEVVSVVDTGSIKGHRLRDLLQRNNVPHGTYEPTSEVGNRLMGSYGLGVDDLPAFVLFDGRALKDPTERQLADAITGQTDITLDEVDVIVVGGGNSAGQAALHLSKFAARVTLLVRGSSLAESMSEYLIDDMNGTPRISIEFGCEIVDAGGDGGLDWLSIKDRNSGEIRRVDAAALFVLIGAVPSTSWLPESLARDPWGFVLTGRDVEDTGAWPLRRSTLAFETSLPGVFAVGDVRHGSVKRVASAVGEGAVSIQSVHRFLATQVSAPV